MPIKSNGTESVEIEPDTLGQALFDALLSEHPSSSLLLNGVQCCNLKGQGRGLVAATKPINKGQVVLSIPLEAAITPEKAAQMSSLGRLLGNDNDQLFQKTPLPDWTLLALWLAELLNSETLQTKNATHAAYAAVLPTEHSTGCVLEWSSEEVDWLRDSELYTIATDIRTAAENSWKEVYPIIQQAERDGLIKTGILSESSLKHAFALLLSRLIRVSFNTTTSGVGGFNGRNEVEVLCPLADFVNHDSTCTSFLQLDQKNENIILMSDRGYRPGEQVFASYGGHKTSGQLLLSYGFVPEEGSNSNSHDACLLSVPSGGKGEKVLFPVKMGAVPQSLLETLALESSSSTSEESSRSSGEQLLVDLCKKKLETYSIGLEEAKAELLTISSGSGGGETESGRIKGGSKSINLERRQAVLKILIQEQKILARTIFLMKQQLKAQASKR